MREIILVKMGEIVLKGLNRGKFENALIQNIRKSIKDLGEFKIRNSSSTLYVIPQYKKEKLEITEYGMIDFHEIDFDETLNRISKVFGIATLARACEVEKNIDDIIKSAILYLKDSLMLASSFKVESKRSDKTFEMKSPEISATVGGAILEEFPNLKVDVHNPDVTVKVEIREFGAYVSAEIIKGAGGIPVGTGGKAAILISGGIDSPVAAWMMNKRGVELTAIHFASPPYTSERAERKVVDLLKKVSLYGGHIKMFIVPFTQIQEKIHHDCQEELFTLIMRRVMMKISQRIAEKEGCQALITGESLGQVASQTMGAIYCVDCAATMPVFRPLIGMDKEEIISISRKIDTFDISIRPYQDCCTVFTPKHPRTKPVLKYVERGEEEAHLESLIEEAILNVSIKNIGYGEIYNERK